VKNLIFAEFLGAGFLLIAVVGSGIMAETLADGNTALALLANAIATGCMLYCIITLFGPVSGAHFNPIVTLAFVVRGDMPIKRAGAYIAAQIFGAIAGVLLTHAMFDQSLFQLSQTSRTGAPLWISEIFASFGLAADHFRRLGAKFQSHCLNGGALYYRCLLVHRLHKLRQSSRQHRPGVVRYICRHLSGPCANVYLMPTDRDGLGTCGVANGL
jgi:hypothetical protein